MEINRVRVVYRDAAPLEHADFAEFVRYDPASDAAYETIRQFVEHYCAQQQTERGRITTQQNANFPRCTAPIVYLTVALVDIAGSRISEYAASIGDHTLYIYTAWNEGIMQRHMASASLVNKYTYAPNGPGRLTLWVYVVRSAQRGQLPPAFARAISRPPSLLTPNDIRFSGEYTSEVRARYAVRQGDDDTCGICRESLLRPHAQAFPQFGIERGLTRELIVLAFHVPENLTNKEIAEANIPHIFHETCIVGLLQSDAASHGVKCPVCRRFIQRLESYSLEATITPVKTESKKSAPRPTEHRRTPPPQIQQSQITRRRLDFGDEAPPILDPKLTSELCELLTNFMMVLAFKSGVVARGTIPYEVLRDRLPVETSAIPTYLTHAQLRIQPAITAETIRQIMRQPTRVLPYDYVYRLLSNDAHLARHILSVVDTTSQSELCSLMHMFA